MFRTLSWLLLFAAFPTTADLLAQQVRDRTTAPGVTSRLNPYAPGLQPEYQVPSWRLGVEVQNTEAGVLVVGVYPNTAAQRQGIEVGDVLVAIGGYQVGYVGGVLYDISDEFTLRADRFGRVDMLVQNRRDGRLVNMTIGLDPRGTDGMIPIWPPITPPVVETTHRLVGLVSYRESIRLPNNARLRVELVEFDRLGRERRVVAQHNATTLGQQKPLSYDLTFRTAALDPANKYAIRAYLDVERAYTLYMPVPTPISPTALPSRIDLVLTAPR